LVEHSCGDANDTASRSGARVARLLALLVPAFSEVVGTGVDDDGAPQNAVLADQLDQAVGDAALGVALAVRLEVPEVTDVALAVDGGAVRLAVWVVVRTGAGAAVGVVAKLVDVHATLGVGVVPGDVPGDGGGRGLGGLLEGHLAGDLGVSSEDGDCFDHFDGLIGWVCAKSEMNKVTVADGMI